MKTIGIVGGLSWPSTLLYYQVLNEEIFRLSDGRHTGHIQVDSWDFPPADASMHRSDWISLEREFAISVQRLVSSGSEVIALACNSLHRCIQSLRDEDKARIVHILDPVCEEINKLSVCRPLLISTKFTADSQLYKEYIENSTRASVDTLTGVALDTSHQVIFDELVRGVPSEAGRANLLAAIRNSITEETDALILGCTELCLAVKASDFAIPVLDTTALHAHALAKIALFGDVK